MGRLLNGIGQSSAPMHMDSSSGVPIEMDSWCGMSAPSVWFLRARLASRAICKSGLLAEGRSRFGPGWPARPGRHR